MAYTQSNEIKTRISLKYDTLANWNASTFKLLPGELAIVSLGETKDGTVAGDVNQHPVLFKVGTGNHTFSELPFASALAADVYAWAKASDVTLEGKTIKFVGTDKTITLNYITEAEANDLISAALASYSTTEQMNAAIKVETDRATVAEEALGARIDAFNLPEGGFASSADFEALKGKVEDEDGALARANAAYELAEGKTTMAEVEGKGYALASEMTTALAGKADAATTYNKTEVDNALAEKATVEALNGVKATAEQGVADAATAQAAAEAAQAEIDAFMGTIEAGGDAVDTLQEVLDLIKSGDDVATGLLKDVSDLKAADTTLQGNIDKKADQTTVDGIEDRVEALEAKPFDTYATKTEVENVNKKFADYTTTTDLTTLLAGKEEAGAAATAEQNAKDYADGLNTTMSGRVDALEAIDHTKYALSSDLEATNTEVAKKANDADLAAIAKTGNVADLIQTENTYVLFNCGSATTVI